MLLPLVQPDNFFFFFVFFLFFFLSLSSSFHYYSPINVSYEIDHFFFCPPRVRGGRRVLPVKDRRRVPAVTSVAAAAALIYIPHSISSGDGRKERLFNCPHPPLKKKMKKKLGRLLPSALFATFISSCY